jgi:alginate O-acetyltransferase complex protein AlgI
LTMLLGGLWHGAAWTFVVWGGLHGCYLMINHGWQAWRPAYLDSRNATTSRLWTLAASALTFLSVMIGWVFFRSTTMETALLFISRMFTPNSGFFDLTVPSELGIVMDFELACWLGFATVIAWMFPNTQEWISYAERCGPTIRMEGRPLWSVPFLSQLRWKPSRSWAVVVGVIVGLALLSLAGPSEFIYFQF